MGEWSWSKKFVGVGARKNSAGKKTFYIRYRMLDGRRVMERVGSEVEGYTLQLAYRIRQRRIQEARHGDLLPRQPQSFTVGELLDAWTEYSRKRSRRDDEQRIAQHIRPELGATRARELRPDDCLRLYRRLREEGRSDATARHCLVILRTAWNRGAERGLVTGMNPASLALRQLGRPEPNRRLRYMSLEEYQALLEAVAHSRASWELCVVGWNTGARFGELARLRWADVDLAHRYLTFRETKTGEPRRVPINREVLAVFDAKPRGLPEVLVWPTRTGRVYTDPPSTLRRAMDRLFNAGVEDRRQRVSFHTLRHSFISHLVMRGVPLPVIQSLTGHKTLDMLQRYTHLAPDARWSAVEGLVVAPGRAGPAVGVRVVEGGVAKKG